MERKRALRQLVVDILKNHRNAIHTTKKNGTGLYRIPSGSGCWRTTEASNISWCMQMHFFFITIIYLYIEFSFIYIIQMEIDRGRVIKYRKFLDMYITSWFLIREKIYRSGTAEFTCRNLLMWHEEGHCLSSCNTPETKMLVTLCCPAFVYAFPWIIVRTVQQQS